MKDEHEYKMINTKDILVDELYQRDIQGRRVSLIVKDFEACLVNAPKVSYRDRKYYVFDGQHTIAALKAMNGGEDCVVECKVYYGLTELDELELFLAQTGHSAKLSTNEKLRPQNNAGNPTVTAMVKAVEMAELRIDFSKGAANGKIVATGALMKEFNKVKPNDFVAGLVAIRKVWNGSPASLRGEILRAVIEFCSVYHGEYDEERLVKCLKPLDPLDIIRTAKQQVSGGDTRFPRAILMYYNKGLRNKLADKI